MTFKSFLHEQQLFEDTFNEIKRLGEPNQQTFLDVMKRTISAKARNALQIYILALIIGIPKDKLLATSTLNDSPEIKNMVAAALTSPAGMGYMKDFAEQVRKINGIDDNQIPDFNNPEVVNLIKTLSDKYGQSLDIENIKDKIKEPKATV